MQMNNERSNMNQILKILYNKYLDGRIEISLNNA